MPKSANFIPFFQSLNAWLLFAGVSRSLRPAPLSPAPPRAPFAASSTTTQHTHTHETARQPQQHTRRAESCEHNVVQASWLLLFGPPSASPFTSPCPLSGPPRARLPSPSPPQYLSQRVHRNSMNEPHACACKAGCTHGVEPARKTSCTSDPSPSPSLPGGGSVR